MANQNTIDSGEREQRRDTPEEKAQAIEEYKKILAIEGIPDFEIVNFTRFAQQEEVTVKEIKKKTSDILEDYDQRSQQETQETSEIDLDREPQVSPVEAKKLIEWAKKQALKETDSEVDTDDILDQLLMLEPSEDAQTGLKKWLKEKNKEEKFLVKFTEWMNRSGVYRTPDLGSFAWQSAMAKLLDERLQEFDAVEFETGIKLKLFERSLEMGDEFNARVYLMSLAKASEFNQTRLDKFHQAFCKRREIDPKNPGVKIPVPDVRQFWFEQKVRKLATKEGGTFNVSKTSRYETVWEGGKIKVGIRSRDKVMFFADVTATEVGGRRSPQNVAPDSFLHSMIGTQLNMEQEAEAVNKMLEERMSRLLPAEMRILNKRIQLRQSCLIDARYRGDQDEAEKLAKRIKQLNAEKAEKKEQERILRETIGQDKNYFKKGDLKPMMLDPLSEAYVEVGGKKWKEKDLAMDIGLIKYMVTKSVADTRYTVEGEHVSFVDINAFRQMFGFRRRAEYRWATHHSQIGARNLSDKSHDSQRDAYENLVKVLESNPGDPRYRDFALRSQGFYIDNYEYERGQSWIVAPSIVDPAILVAVMPATQEIVRNYHECGFYDPQVAINNWESNFTKKIEEAEKAGRIVQKSAPERKIEQELGQTGEAILTSMRPELDEEEFELKDDSTKGATHILLEKAQKIDLSELLEKGAEEDIFQIYNGTPIFMGGIARTEADNQRLSPAIVSGIQQAFEEEVRKFRMENLADAYQEFSQLSDEQILDYKYPAIDYNDLLIEKDLRRFRDEIEENKPAVEKLLDGLNKEMKQVCMLLILGRAVKVKINEKIEIIKTRDGDAIDFDNLDIQQTRGVANDCKNKLGIARRLRTKFVGLYGNYADITSYKISSQDRGKSKDKESKDLKKIFGESDTRVDSGKNLSLELLMDLQYFELAYQAIQQKMEKNLREATTLKKETEEESGEGAKENS